MNENLAVVFKIIDPENISGIDVYSNSEVELYAEKGYVEILEQNMGEDLLIVKYDPETNRIIEKADVREF